MTDDDTSTDDTTGLLAYGQLSVWRVLANWPVERWPETYLSAVVPVPADCPLDRVVRAFGTLCDRHESLRTLFTDGPQGPRQRVLPAGARPPGVAVVECPGADAELAEARGRLLAGEPFDREREFSHRFAVVTEAGRPAHAVLVLDHLLADGFALDRLRSELAALLGADVPDGHRWLAETPAQPRQLAAAQRSEENRRRREAVVRHWRRLLDTLPAELFPVPDDAGHRPGRIEAVLRSPGARSSLARAGERLGILPQGVMLAVNSVATAAVTGSTRVVHTLQSSNRFSAPWRTAVTSMNQFAVLPLDLDRTPDSFAEYARYVQGSSLRAYQLASYDIDVVNALVREERGITLGFDHFFNFMATDVTAAPPPDPGAAPAAPRVETTRPNRQIGPRFDVKVWGGPDMPVVVRADPRLIDQPRLNALLGWFDEELGRLATDGATGVTAALHRCTAAIGG
ncbi:condensation domain-containing protein [Kitasatospora viridis]|uniref:Condensation domain-containing protein n=1 Tax=Kitasatospora viridis TaxID=281105 RepID=A0A561UHW4_9ACTN|nr:condensation domain-containing protein [Kitasatospora viridis]TWF98953.1 condensation domain-containing protein [Kitasatospora viridis]